MIEVSLRALPVKILFYLTDMKNVVVILIGYGGNNHEFYSIYANKMDLWYRCVERIGQADVAREKALLVTSSGRSAKESGALDRV